MFISALKSTGFAYNFLIFVNILFVKSAEVQYPDMPAIQVDTAGIAKLLGEIDPYKAMGPDGIPPKLLKELANEVAPCMGLMFSASLK